jgi:hypothetical protein
VLIRPTTATRQPPTTNEFSKNAGALLSYSGRGDSPSPRLALRKLNCDSIVGTLTSDQASVLLGVLEWRNQNEWAV